MPQVSLYFDKSTLGAVEAAARAEQLSVSRWVREKVIRTLREDWPDSYFQLFGSVEEPDLKRPRQPGEFSARLRESL